MTDSVTLCHVTHVTLRDSVTLSGVNCDVKVP